MSTTIIITIASGIIIFLAGMCLHYIGLYNEAKDIAEKLSDYIAKLDEEK